MGHRVPADRGRGGDCPQGRLEPREGSGQAGLSSLPSHRTPAGLRCGTHAFSFRVRAREPFVTLLPQTTLFRNRPLPGPRASVRSQQGFVLANSPLLHQSHPHIQAGVARIICSCFLQSLHRMLWIPEIWLPLCVVTDSSTAARSTAWRDISPSHSKTQAKQAIHRAHQGMKSSKSTESRRNHHFPRMQVVRDGDTSPAYLLVPVPEITGFREGPLKEAPWGVILSFQSFSHIQSTFGAPFS